MRKLTVLFQQAPGAPAAAGYYVAWEAGVLQYKATADADATALFAPDGGQVLCMRASDGALYCQGRQVGGLQGQGLLTAR